MVASPMLQRELNDLLDAAVTVRVKRKASERRQLRAETGHLEPTEYRVLLEMIEQRSCFVEAAVEDGRWDPAWPPAGHFPLSYAALRANMVPRRKDAKHSVPSRKVMTKAMEGLVEAGVLDRRRLPSAKYEYRFELDVDEARAPVDEEARRDVRLMISEAQLPATAMMVMAQLRYLARDRRLRLDWKEVELETGVTRKTVRRTLERLLPEKLGYCAGLAHFAHDAKGLEIKFQTPDCLDRPEVRLDPPPLEIIGLEGPEPPADEPAAPDLRHRTTRRSATISDAGEAKPEPAEEGAATETDALGAVDPLDIPFESLDVPFAFSDPDDPMLEAELSECALPEVLAD